jgi:hypothetical protein
VHGGDLEGTWKRFEIAAKVVEIFGVTSECGMGRMSKDEFDSVLEILATVAAES